MISACALGPAALVRLLLLSVLGEQLEAASAVHAAHSLFLLSIFAAVLSWLPAATGWALLAAREFLWVCAGALNCYATVRDVFALFLVSTGARTPIPSERGRPAA